MRKAQQYTPAKCTLTITPGVWKVELLPSSRPYTDCSHTPHPDCGGGRADARRHGAVAAGALDDGLREVGAGAGAGVACGCCWGVLQYGVDCAAGWGKETGGGSASRRQRQGQLSACGGGACTEARRPAHPSAAASARRQSCRRAPSSAPPRVRASRAAWRQSRGGATGGGAQPLRASLRVPGAARNRGLARALRLLGACLAAIGFYYGTWLANGAKASRELLKTVPFTMAGLYRGCSTRVYTTTRLNAAAERTK